jgi:hypothetical protein
MAHVLLRQPGGFEGFGSVVEPFETQRLPVVAKRDHLPEPERDHAPLALARISLRRSATTLSVPASISSHSKRLSSHGSFTRTKKSQTASRPRIDSDSGQSREGRFRPLDHTKPETQPGRDD